MATFTANVVLEYPAGTEVFFVSGDTIPTWAYPFITNLGVVNGTIPTTPPAGSGSGRNVTLADNGDGTGTITVT